MFLLTVPILLLASPVSVLACEGECIAGITSAWLRNYTSPLYSVFQLTVRFQAATHTLFLTFCRPSRFHKNCSPMRVTMTRCYTSSPSSLRTIAARTTVWKEQFFRPTFMASASVTESTHRAAQFPTVPSCVALLARSCTSSRRCDSSLLITREARCSSCARPATKHTHKLSAASYKPRLRRTDVETSGGGSST